MNETLHPHEIQIAIFSQLLTCETLLKPEYKMSIDRCFNATFLVYILRSYKGRPSTLFCWKLAPANISTPADVEEHIRLFWNDVPNKYKKTETTMKTPKRVYVSMGGDTDDVITARKAKKYARWKRKNRIAQLKRTIARLKKEKEAAYHKGHKDGYDSGFARGWF